MVRSKTGEYYKVSPTLVISNTTKKGILTSKEKALTGEDILLIGMIESGEGGG